MSIFRGVLISILRSLPSRKKEIIFKSAFVGDILVPEQYYTLPPILMEVKSRVPLIVVTFTAS